MIKFYLSNFLVSTIISISIFILIGNQACDDSFIHYRVAENLALHGKPFFSLADPVNISSSPIWTLILALIYLLPGNTYFWLIIFNSLIISAVTCIWCALSETSDFSSYWLAFALSLLMIQTSVTDQMETPFAGLFFFASLLLLKRQRYYLCVMSAMSLGFIRPELIILSLILLICIIQQCSNFRAVILVGILFFNILFIVIFNIFGSVIPHSIYVKSIIYDIESSQTFLDLLSGRDDWPLIIRLMPYFSLFYVVRLNIWSRICALFIILLSSAYIIKHTFIFSWYVCLIHWPLAFIAFNAAIKNRKALLIIVLFNVPFIYDLYLNCNSKHRYELRSARVKTYLYLSSILSRYSDESTKLLVAEIGAISYQFKGTIIDGAGLASPRALQFHPMVVPDQRVHGSVAAIPKKLFDESKPDILLAYDLFLTDVAKSQYLKNYHIVNLPLFAKPWINILNQNETFWSSKNLKLLINKKFKSHAELMRDLKEKY